MSDRDVDTTRRDFLHRSCGLAIACVTAVIPRDLLALPFQNITGTVSGSEHTYPVPAVDGVGFDRGAQLILVRAQNHVYAFALSCPHQNAALRWVEKDHRFQCTKHDSKYQPDGAYTSGRATRNMDRLAIRRTPTGLVVDVTHAFHSDTDAAGWAAATVVL